MHSCPPPRPLPRTVYPVFPCLKPPSAPASPALHGHSLWQTGGVCSHICSHTASFTLRVTVASERLREAGELRLMGSVGKVLPPPAEGTGRDGYGMQRTGSSLSRLWESRDRTSRELMRHRSPTGGWPYSLFGQRDLALRVFLTGQDHPKKREAHTRRQAVY